MSVVWLPAVVQLEQCGLAIHHCMLINFTAAATDACLEERKGRSLLALPTNCPVCHFC